MAHPVNICLTDERPIRPLDGDGWQWRVAAASEIDLSVLTGTDRREAVRFRLSWQRNQFLVTRALLRSALTHVSQGRVLAADWRFSQSDSGKPCVARGLPPLHFSVSHSQGASVVAIATDVPVGVDLERLDQHTNKDLIELFCSAGERSRVRRIAEADRGRAFLQLWTLKEAYAKMTGFASFLQFAQLDFAGEPPRLTGHPEAAFSSLSKFIGGKPFQVSLSWLKEGSGHPLSGRKLLFAVTSTASYAADPIFCWSEAHE
jgi:4'-phosphopantetheinyl transferase